MKDIFIPEFCEKIIECLNAQGFEAYLVGGCVRDSLMGKTPHDYDIATNATPSEMKKAFCDLKVVSTGEKHGTLTVIVDNNAVEVTTYRIDGDYCDNRRPQFVEFTRNIEEDLSRRDFTVNALAYNKKSGLIDLFCGENDIKNKIIKCVGEPDKRFLEDSLRILRALRFASCLGFEIEKNTAKSIIKNKDLLKNISAERIFLEFKQLLQGENAEKILIDFKEVFAVFIPEIRPCFDFDQKTKYHQYDVYTHIVKTVSACESDEILRLACFFHDIEKPSVFFTDENGVGHFYGHPKPSAETTRAVLKRLKADNKTIETVVDLVLYHDRQIATSEKSVKRFLSKTSPEFFKHLIKIKRADSLAHAKEYQNKEEYYNSLLQILEKIEKEEQCFKIKDLKINGNDLINLGFCGEKIGIVLKKLLAGVIDEKVKNEKQELLSYIKKEIV